MTMNMLRKEPFITSILEGFIRENQILKKLLFYENVMDVCIDFKTTIKLLKHTYNRKSDSKFLDNSVYFIKNLFVRNTVVETVDL